MIKNFLFFYLHFKTLPKRKLINVYPNVYLQGFINEKKIIFRSRQESEVAGFFVFSHMRMMDYFRLFRG